MSAKENGRRGPKGKTAAEATRDRARRSDGYREARDEYAAIRELRQRNWIAAHIRERRFELDLTQRDVADRAETSHSFISKVEGGDHIPTIPVLKRILAVLDEELLIGIERRVPDEEPEREVGDDELRVEVDGAPEHRGGVLVATLFDEVHGFDVLRIGRRHGPGFVRGLRRLLRRGRMDEGRTATRTRRPPSLGAIPANARDISFCWRTRS